MFETLANLDPLLKTFWYVAIPVSLIFLIQTVMTFIGGAADSIDADFDGDIDGHDTPFQLFSLRNLINFLLGFSWTGISFFTTVSSKLFLIIFAILVGFLFVYLFFIIIKQVQKLAEDNSFKIENTIGKTAEVYLPIPANKSGKGKVMISVNGAFHELDAMTANDRIPSNAIVRVLAVDTNILIVETI
ncbi:MAG: NfeD family protein [Crocinitomicaceae bacterium]|nr:NfeD family protein [Crocinitomicaceae bacterium]